MQSNSKAPDKKDTIELQGDKSVIAPISDKVCLEIVNYAEKLLVEIDASEDFDKSIKAKIPFDELIYENFGKYVVASLVPYDEKKVILLCKQKCDQLNELLSVFEGRFEFQASGEFSCEDLSDEA